MPQPRLLISKSALEQNLRALIGESGGRAAFPVVKANAYGLGFKEISQAFASFSDSEVPYFCLARMYEVAQALALGEKRGLLLLSEWPADLRAVPPNVTLTAGSFGDLAALAESKQARRFHVKINSGMNRLGISMGPAETATELASLFAKIKKCGHFLEGIYSHLASGDEAANLFSAEQSRAFVSGVQTVESLWGEPVRWKHLANSPGVLNHVGRDLKSVNAFRPGIHLWGIRDPEARVEMAPVLSLRAPLRQIYWIEKGESVGYSRRFIAQRKTRVGVLNLGYADGLRRDAWNKRLAFSMDGSRAPFLGVISMDMCAVDCTDIASALEVGQEFEWIGAHQSVETIAEALGTIPYEVLTSLAPRVERVLE